MSELSEKHLLHPNLCGKVNGRYYVSHEGLRTSSRFITEQHRRIRQHLDADARSSFLSTTTALVHVVPDSRVSTFFQTEFQNNLLHDTMSLILRGRRWESEICRIP